MNKNNKCLGKHSLSLSVKGGGNWWFMPKLCMIIMKQIEALPRVVLSNNGTSWWKITANLEIN